jgi:subtilisin family serine protease
MDGTFILAADDNNIDGDPIEILGLNYSGSGSVKVQLGLELFSGTAPQRIKYWYRGPMTIDQHDTASGTVFGHSSAAGARAVGAAFYDETPAFGQNPPLLESFSSAGPSRIYFDTLGNPLSPFETRQKPEIVAPDGTNTTFFGADIPEDADSYPNFFGTSAAAPHAAAVAALMLDDDPSLTPNDVYQTLQDTAIDMLTPGFDDDSGFGLIDAAAALGVTPLIDPTEGTIGTQVEITNLLSLGEKQPKVLIGESKCKVETFTASSVSCLLKKVKSTNPPETTYDVTIIRKGKGVEPIVLPNAFSIMAPSIATITPNSGLPTDSVTITGSFFGPKKVKAFMDDGMGGKAKKGKIVSLTMDPNTGASTLEILVPTKLAPGVYNVTVTNKVGEDTLGGGFTIQ